MSESRMQLGANSTPATQAVSREADVDVPPSPQSTGEPLSGPVPAAAPGLWSSLRPLLLRLHFYAGILIGPFIFVAAVTGLAYTVTPQVESLLYKHELEVTPRGTAEPLADQVAAAKRAVPDGTLLSVTQGAEPTDSIRVTFGKDGLPEGYTLTAFVDPYDNKVLGELKTFSQWLPARAWLDDLHRNLHLGDFGRNYSEIAASWLWVEVLGGLALWAGTPSNRQRLRRLLLPRGGAKGRKRTRSWHGAVGLWASVGLLALSATGLTWSAHAGASIGKIQDALGGSTPAVSTALPPPGARTEAREARRRTSASTRSSPRAATPAWSACSSSPRPPTRTPRTSWRRTRGVGPSSRTPLRSTRPPVR
ncbi:PepSY-associated TM helix domain-containing protein [Streptomyces malaysiensis]|uniref:PepSY-associated TM helix domain-containing protein n=1 Tax=Streptomyces malaysiensis TaxID=92644 RepID=UPI0037233626